MELKQFELYPEITCPFCRMNLGSVFMIEDKIHHLDISWSSEAGLRVECEQDNVLTLISSVPDRGKVILSDGFEAKINEIHKINDVKPTEFNNETLRWHHFKYAFMNSLNYGSIESDSEEIDRSKISWDDVRVKFDLGKNLYEIMRTYIIESID